MSQEDENLLLKDLCARLPYGVMVEFAGQAVAINGINFLEHYLICNFKYFINYFKKDIKPYLRPMEWMTDEEYDDLCECSYSMFLGDSKEIDWLNAHHFDYRGLIEKGLALESKEGMYK